MGARGALEGIKVIDLTRQMAGPYGTLVLGDFGADVIKVESSPRGDPSRGTGQYFVGGESTMFLTWNRNKRSIAVDLRRPDGVEVVRRLTTGADLFVENYRPGVATKIGLGWDVLHAVNPRLVYVSCSAFGAQGPWAHRPGTDPVVQAMSGVMSVTGERDGPPVLVGVPVADYSSAMLVVQACLLGLCARGLTGEGQLIETSMLGALLFSLTTRVGPFLLTGEDPVRWGSSHSQVVPYGAFETADGWGVVGTWGDPTWAPFCTAIGAPELATDERFNTNLKRLELRDQVVEILKPFLRRHTNTEWERIFEEHHVLFAPVNSFSGILNHPQTAANGWVAEVDHPTAGRLREIAPVITMHNTPASIRRPPPVLGEHTREVLSENGWSDAEIDHLLGEQVVQESSEPATDVTTH